MGTPCSGPQLSSRASAVSASRARFRAPSSSKVMMALSEGLYLAMRSRYASSSSVADTFRLRIRAASSVAEANTRSSISFSCFLPVSFLPRPHSHSLCRHRVHSCLQELRQLLIGQCALLRRERPIQSPQPVNPSSFVKSFGGDYQPALVPHVILWTDAGIELLEVLQRAVPHPIRRQLHHPFGQHGPHRQLLRLCLGNVGVQAEVGKEFHQPQPGKYERDLLVEQVSELVNDEQIGERGHADLTVHRAVKGFHLGALLGSQDVIEHSADALEEIGRRRSHYKRFPFGGMRHAVGLDSGVLRPVLGREYQQAERRIELQHTLQVVVGSLATCRDALRPRLGTGTEQHREGRSLHMPKRETSLVGGHRDLLTQNLTLGLWFLNAYRGRSPRSSSGRGV